MSIYGGIRIKERSLARELDQLDETNTEVQHEAKRARIAQCVGDGKSNRRLENERKELLAEGRDLDMKIQEVRSRMRA